MLQEKVLRTIHAHQMLKAGDRVAVAVSGGSDSVALLVLLHRMAPRLSLDLQVAHFNHRLRGAESQEDEKFVQCLARELSLNCLIESADVRAYALSHGMNGEAAARLCRYRFLRNLAASGQVNKIALGHTAGDQAETFLMRLLRGAGMRGLAAIHPVVDNAFVRPLLDVTREEIEEFLRQEGIAWREDATNSDRTRTRNRIRHDLLPALRAQYNPEIVTQLARTAEQCRLDDELLTQLAAAEFKKIQQPLTSAAQKTKGALGLSASGLAQLAPALFGRVVRLAIQDVCGHLLRIEESHVDSIARLVDEGQSGDAVDLPHRLRVERAFDLLCFRQVSAQPDEPKNYNLPVPIPGLLRLPNAAKTWRVQLMDRIHWEKAAKEGSRKADKERDGQLTTGASFDYAKIASLLEAPKSSCLAVREVRAGDRYRPKGRSHVIKVTDLLAELHVAASERRGWPVLVAGEKVLWMWGGREAWEVAVTPASHQILVIGEVDDRGE